MSEYKKLDKNDKFRIGTILLPDPEHMKYCAEEQHVFEVVPPSEAVGKNGCRPGVRNYVKCTHKNGKACDTIRYYEASDASVYLIKDTPVICRKRPTTLHLR